MNLTSFHLKTKGNVKHKI